MADITTRTGKGAALTHSELDDNFTNLNTDKAELSGADFTGNVGVDGNISVTGTVDGRDVATDGTKLDGIEASADVTDTTNVVASLTAGTNITIASDGTISATDTNTQLTNEEVQDIVGAMLSGNTETGITVTYQDADGTIDFVVDTQTDENFTTALKNKLDAIEAGATADQTAAEIRALVEAATDSNVFTDADHAKLNGIEASADVTDTDNVVASLTAGSNITISAGGVIASTASGDVVDDTTPQLGGDLDLNSNDITGTGDINTTGDITVSGTAQANALNVGSSQQFTVTNIGKVTTSSYVDAISYRVGATTVIDSSRNLENVGNITLSGTVDGRDVASDGTKLDGIEASADVTDTTNVTAAGAVMDSELTSEASVKALNQGVATTDSPSFAGLTVDTNTLKVDSSNNRVGILNASPDVTLDVGSATDAVHVPVGTTAQRPSSPAAGYLRYNSTIGEFEGYTTAWAALGSDASASNISHQDEVGNGTQTSFTLENSAAAKNNTQIYIDGVYQNKTSYSLTNGAIVFSEAPPSLAEIDIITIDPTTINEPADGSVTSAKLSGDLTTPGDLTVNGNVEFDGLSGTGSVTVTDILDQDDMSGDSATALATQQSIKAYVDSQVATADTLAEVLANGNTTSGTNIELTTTDKVQFRDSAIYLNSSADGQLDIIADTEVQIAATTIDINGNVDISGTAGIGGVLTANAGVVVDNFTIDGAEIDCSADMTLDVAGDLTLDVSGGDVRIKADGTQEMQFKITDGANVDIISTVADDDIRLRGNDGGATITALTLDMSAAGAATFNDKITAVGTSVFTNLDISGDVDVDGTTNLDVVDIDGAVDMASTLQVDGSITSSAKMTITTADNAPQMVLVSTDADASKGPVLDLQRDSGSPAANDLTGLIRFRGDDAGGNVTNYASIASSVKDATGGSEDGQLAFFTMTAGSDTETLTLESGTVIAKGGNKIQLNRADNARNMQVFNDNSFGTIETSNDPIKIASQDYTAFFVSGGEKARLTSDGRLGIGVAAPARKLEISSGHVRLSDDYKLEWGGGTNYIQGSNANNRLIFATNSSEAMRLTSDGTATFAGNVDVTGAITVNGSNIILANSNTDDTNKEGHLLARQYDSGTETEGFQVLQYFANSSGNRVDIGGGSSAYNCATAITFNTAGNTTTRTGFEAMRIDSSGNVGVKQTSPGSYYAKDLVVGAGSAEGGITVRGSSSGRSYLMFADGTSGNQQYRGYLSYNHADDMLEFATGAAAHAYLDVSGNFLVGTTYSSTTSGAGLKITKPTTSGNADGKLAITGGTSTSAQDAFQIYSTGASAYRCFINYAGSIYATSTSITAISDESLKENIRDLDKGLDTVLALQPRRFDWKNGDGNDIMGFVAQEVEEVMPELVHDFKYSETETKLGLKMGDMVPTLVKAIQDQQEIIENLKSRIEQLEGAN